MVIFPTDAHTHNSKSLDAFSAPSGSVIVCDPVYLDFAWLRVLNRDGVFFIKRLKTNVHFEVIAEYYHNRLEGEKCDCEIVLIRQAA